MAAIAGAFNSPSPPPGARVGARKSAMPCGMKPLFADGAAPAASPSKDGVDGVPSKTARTPGGSTYRPSKINRSGDIAPETSRVFEYVSGKINAIEDEKELARMSRELAEEEKRERAAAEADEKERAAALTARRLKADEEHEAATQSTPAPLLQSAPVLALSFSIGGEYDGTLSGDAIAFNEPSCLTALPDGELCVADTKNHRLVILTPEGQPRAFLTERPQTSRGKKSSQLQKPRGVACDDYNIYVSEVGGSTLRKLRLPDEFRKAGASTPRGAKVGEIALESEPTARSQLTFPQGITHSDGELFVCDCEDHCVVVYDASTLTHVRSFGSPGYEEGELSFPYSCAVIGSEVLVADVGNHRLSSFSRRTGKFVRCIGQEGDAPGSFQSPRAVAPLQRKPPAAASTSGSSALLSLFGVGDESTAVTAANGGGGGSGIFVDDEMVLLPKETLLVVCEQQRIQVLELSGTPLQILTINNATDLWSITSIGTLLYVSDRGRNCVHVLGPPRAGSGSMTARARSPIKQGGHMTARNMDQEEHEERRLSGVSCSRPPSDRDLRRKSSSTSSLSPATIRSEPVLDHKLDDFNPIDVANGQMEPAVAARVAAARERMRVSKMSGSRHADAASAALAEAEEAAKAARARVTTLAGGGGSNGLGGVAARPLPPAVITGGSSVRPGSPPRSPKGHMSPKSGHMTARNVDEEEYGERRLSGVSCSRPPSDRELRRRSNAGASDAALSPGRGGSSSSSSSALSEAVRRIRTGDTQQSPPQGSSSFGAWGMSPAMSIATGSGPHIGTYEDIVPGGLSVLGRGHALHAAQAGNGHLEPACVLSPRSQPGGVSVKLGGKPKKAPALATLRSAAAGKSAKADVQQRI